MEKKPSEWRGVGTERFRVTRFSRLGCGEDDETSTQKEEVRGEPYPQGLGTEKLNGGNTEIRRLSRTPSGWRH